MGSPDPRLRQESQKFDTPYLRDFLLDMGAAGDVSETATPWSSVVKLHSAAQKAAQEAYDSLGVKGWIMSHMSHMSHSSHSYHSGACLYFIFAFTFGDDPLGEYDTVKRAIQQSFVDNDGTISHHHGVGVEHSPWLEQDISPEGLKIVRGLFAAAGTENNFNPGKIAPVEGASVKAAAVKKVVAAKAPPKKSSTKATAPRAKATPTK